MGLGSGIRDPEKIIRDPGSKRHRIPDPQHCFCIFRQFIDFVRDVRIFMSIKLLQQKACYPLPNYLFTTYPPMYLLSTVTHHCSRASFLRKFAWFFYSYRFIFIVFCTTRYEALLSVQKLMVHNWEYLGKQLEKPPGGPQVSSNRFHASLNRYRYPSRRTKFEVSKIVYWNR